MSNENRLKIRHELAQEINVLLASCKTNEDVLEKVANHLHLVYDQYIYFLSNNIGRIERKTDEDGNLLSCCGDILDPDNMICPTCKEHN